MLGRLVSVNRETAENAVRTLTSWAGDDPTRERQFDTPARVVRSYEEFFAGYLGDPAQILSWRRANACAQKLQLACAIA
jgi:GTP cyclohydrolase I